MIDLKAARANPDAFRAALARKGAAQAFDELLEADGRCYGEAGFGSFMLRMDEIKMIENEKPVKKLRHMIHGHLKKYLLPVLAGFVIASPLPDEIGVCLLAGSKISPRAFSLFSYAFNTLGILAILAIGNAVYV